MESIENTKLKLLSHYPLVYVGSVNTLRFGFDEVSNSCPWSEFDKDRDF